MDFSNEKHVQRTILVKLLERKGLFRATTRGIHPRLQLQIDNLRANLNLR